VNYLDCQEAYEDEDEGLQIYSGVTCDGSGNLIIGTFYNDECTVKHSTGQAYFDFTYEGFQTVQAYASSRQQQRDRIRNGRPSLQP